MTQALYDLIQEENKKVTQESKDKYQGKAGIYGIYCEDELIYIGKSTDMLKRFIAHKTNTICSESNEYNRPMYMEMRRALNAGLNIHCEELEFCTKEELNSKEDYYIGLHLPPLNTIIPNKCGGHTRKAVSALKLDKKKIS